MNLIEGVSGVASRLGEFFDDFIELAQTSVEALQNFYDMLDDLDSMIVAMIDNCGSNEFSGLPVIKAIATYHYVVGDVVFYLMYMIVLFGCLFTVYKILSLIFKGIMNLVDLFKAYFNTSIIPSLGSFLK